MDGLSAVPPTGDPGYRGLRGELAIEQAIELDGSFGLHPALAPIAPWFGEGALMPVHAVATPYRDRSHFDAQDLLENGTPAPHGADSGWLNRALASFRSGPAPQGLAIGQVVPLVLRGDVTVTTWSPSMLPGAEPDLLARLEVMYADDPLFMRSLEEAVATSSMAGDGGTAAGGARQQAREAVRMAATMLAAADGPRIAVLESTGWDTHANQGADTGRLAAALEGLADTLALFRDSIGSAWRQTALVVVTEFGRTAVPNGTGGTDHGTAGAALVAGGAIAGGRVLADWPGLATGQLHEGRDLRPTLDLRAVLKGLLRDHLGLDEGSLETVVFPDSSAARPLDGLTS
jgi:uncharacterized protein (DUF1501 family)